MTVFLDILGFGELVESSVNIDNQEASIQTIKFASLQNPKYISEQYDYIQIKLLTNLKKRYC